MKEIINFVKDILMLENSEIAPIGLCSFEHTKQQAVRKIAKPKRKRELRLSELME